MYAVFLTQTAAAAAATAIWVAMMATGNYQDRVGSTGKLVSPPITNGWFIPRQRATDGLWVVAINPAVTAVGQGLWTLQSYASTWF